MDLESKKNESVDVDIDHVEYFLLAITENSPGNKLLVAENGLKFIQLVEAKYSFLCDNMCVIFASQT